ncbi:MAG: Uma2 family endonuclease [Armatimonadota bacterium]|nr:Uma2 family endonuclease [Armatimonadota bacterium]
MERPEDAPEPYTHEEFAALAAAYPDLRMELSREGRVIMTPPSGGESSHQSSVVGGRLFAWSEQDGTGMTFDANGGYALPNGATRAPDASWLLRSRWNVLTPEQRRKFLPLCPDFVVEVLSPPDSLAETQEKMREYIENGTCLGWLINPRRKQVEVYRPGQDVEALDNPASVSGDPVLPGFTLNLSGILS